MGEIWKSRKARDAVLGRYAALLQRWPVPAVQRRLPTSQGETFVLASGPADAPPVLLLHGSMANAASWMGDLAVLSEDFRVYVIDMIGEPGFSAPSRPPLASEAYVTWLDEVMLGLDVRATALVGVSLGGWLALDYATRRPERVGAVALLCPGGVGATKNILPWAVPLLLLGAWGRRRVMRRLGAAEVTEPPPSPALQAFRGLMDQIQAAFRPRREPLPRFSDAALQRLKMPVFAVLGGQDVLLDSAETRDRLKANIPHADILWLPDAGHILTGHGVAIEAFLTEALLR